MPEFTTESAEQTVELGRQLGQKAVAGWIVGLAGDLGAGKTTLCRGFVEGAGGDPELVTSPTFTLMQTYEGRHRIHHFDLYRLSSAAEATEIGFTEFVYGQDVALVEWLDRFPDLAPERYLMVVLHTIDESSRRIEIEPVGEGFSEMIAELRVQP